jgi:hypothetical protein
MKNKTTKGEIGMTNETQDKKGMKAKTKDPKKHDNLDLACETSVTIVGTTSIAITFCSSTCCQY